jgi:hypothetical protein
MGLHLHLGKTAVLLDETIFCNPAFLPYYLRRVIVLFSYDEESSIDGE